MSAAQGTFVRSGSTFGSRVLRNLSAPCVRAPGSSPGAGASRDGSSSDSGSDSGVSMHAVSETSAAAGSQVPRASSSEGGMRSVSSSAVQEGALPPPYPAGATGALSRDGRDLQILAEVMDYESQSRHSQSEHAAAGTSTGIAEAAAA